MTERVRTRDLRLSKQASTTAPGPGWIVGEGENIDIEPILFNNNNNNIKHLI